MKLKISKICQLYAAFSALDGIEEVVEVNGKNSVIKKPYSFSGKVRWNLAKNMRILKVHVDAFGKVRDDLIKEISGGEDEIKDTDKTKIKAFTAQLAQVNDSEEEVEGLLVLSPKDLGLDDDDAKTSNRIPLAVLDALSDLIKE